MEPQVGKANGTNIKMANRKRKQQDKAERLKAARLKEARSRRATNAGQRRSDEPKLPSNAICLASYRSAHAGPAQMAVGDGLNRAAPLLNGHSAQIMLFTGVQIVRHESCDSDNG